MQDYFGLWCLEPSASDGVEGPERAVYAIWPSGEQVCFAIGWTGESGPMQAAFALRPGETDTLPTGESVRCTLREDGLRTEVVGTGVWALRTLVEDGRALRITQASPDGQAVAIYRRARVKQVICYRRDLKMRKGKIAAQCAHASMAVLLRRSGLDGLDLSVPMTPEMALWTRWRSAKIVLSVDDEAALVQVHEEARRAGLPTALIRDAGLTEFGGVPTLTAVAVGPAIAAEIDAITGPGGRVATKLA